MDSLILLGLLLVPTSLSLPSSHNLPSAAGSKTSNQFDLPLFQKSKRNNNLDFNQVLENRIYQHKSVLLKYGFTTLDDEDSPLLTRGIKSKRAGTPGSSFLAGNDL